MKTPKDLIEDWAEVNKVIFVNRSYGKYTTGTVSLEHLLDLVSYVRQWERARIHRVITCAIDKEES